MINDALMHAALGSLSGTYARALAHIRVNICSEQNEYFRKTIKIYYHYNYFRLRVRVLPT